MPNKTRDEITYPFPNFNCVTMSVKGEPERFFTDFLTKFSDPNLYFCLLPITHMVNIPSLDSIRYWYKKTHKDNYGDHGDFGMTLTAVTLGHLIDQMKNIQL